jgi:excisionase family DNA binding protein
MLGIDVQFVADGRRLSLNDLADLLAEKVATRITFAKAKERTVQPQQTVGYGEPKVVSVPDAAKLLGLSRSTVWRYIQEKRIETIHLGRRSTRIRMETINRLVKEGIPN